MKKIICVAFACMALLWAASTAQAQSGYSTGIGLRGGIASGLTVKHFFRKDAAIEGILSTNFKHRGTVVTLLYEKHAQAFNTSGLLWYYGLGGHIGFHEGRHYYERHHKHYHHHYYDTVLGVGVDGILGLEYYIKDIPFTIGADIKPYINLNGGGGYWDSALHVRFVF